MLFWQRYKDVPIIQAFLIMLDLVTCALLFIACYEDRAELMAPMVALSVIFFCN